MSDINRLPSNFARAMRQGTTASEAVRNIIKAYDPTWHVVYTNFLGDALPSEWPAKAGTNGTVTVATSQLTLTSTTTDNDSAGQGYGLFWKGDNGIYFESQQSLDALTTVKIETGFTDATGDDGAVNVKATPNSTADDYCVLAFDTDDNTQLDIISRLDAGTAAANAENVHTLVAGTDFTTAFIAQNDAVSVQIGSSSGNLKVAGAGSMQGGDLVTPWFYVQSRAGATTRIYTVEYMLCAGPNGVAP